jgi:uncharacterized membrane protein
MNLSPSGEPRRLVEISRQQQQVTTSFMGPLPPPSILREYNEIIPGLAAKIVDQTDRQTTHRISMEAMVIRSDIYKSWAGLVCGLVVSLTCIGAGVACIFSGHDVAGTTIATGAVGGLVATFIYGTTARKTERTEKARMMTGQPAPGPPATTTQSP